MSDDFMKQFLQSADFEITYGLFIDEMYGQFERVMDHLPAPASPREYAVQLVAVSLAGIIADTMKNQGLPGLKLVWEQFAERDMLEKPEHLTPEGDRKIKRFLLSTVTAELGEGRELILTVAKNEGLFDMMPDLGEADFKKIFDEAYEIMNRYNIQARIALRNAALSDTSGNEHISGAHLSEVAAQNLRKFYPGPRK